MSYITWEWYNSHFPKVDEADFNRLLPVAEMEVDNNTYNRARTAKGYKKEKVKACAANVINTLSDHEKVGAGTGVKSASNDGYSESYENVTKTQADAEIRSVCRKWLSGTGLMGAL